MKYFLLVVVFLVIPDSYAHVEKTPTAKKQSPFPQLSYKKALYA